MALLKPFRLNIMLKLLIVLLSISLISLLLFAVISYYHMKSLGSFALGRSVSLGDQAIADSTSALDDRAKQYLLRLVVDQAALSNTMLRRVRNDVDILTSYATILWRHYDPDLSDPVNRLFKSPISIFERSSVHLVPGVSLDTPRIRKDILIGQAMDYLFQTIFKNNRTLKYVYVATEKGTGYTFPFTVLPDDFDSRKRPWYEEAVEVGKARWSDLYVGAPENELMITCSKPFYDQYGRLTGVVGADITLTAINEKIINTQVGEAGYAFLIDKEGNAIARPGLTPASNKWDDSFETENLLETKDVVFKGIVRDMVSGNTGVARCKFPQGDKYIAYTPLQDIDWYLGIALPEDEVIAPVKNTKNKIINATDKTRFQIHDRIKKLEIIFLGLLIVLLLIVTGIAFRLSRKISHPILALNSGAKKIGGGDLDYRIEVASGDEIEELARSFNRMTEDLKSHIDELQQATAARERIESELRIAKNIQMGFLNRSFPPYPDRIDFDIFATIEPARQVGGDLYDFFFVDEDHLCFLIGDVSGKGVPAALFMAITKILVNTNVIGSVSPHEVMRNVNTQLLLNNEGSMFVTLFLGIMNLKTGNLSYCNAGHNYPYRINAGGKVILSETINGLPLGIMDTFDWESGRIALGKGDMLFLYTDGVPEAMDRDEQFYSDERLEKELTALKDRPITEVVYGVTESVKSFSAGVPPSDDITMLILKYNGP